MKRNKKLILAAISLSLLSGITLSHSFNTNHKQTEDIISKDNIKEKLNTLAVYIKDKDSSDYTKTESIPTKDSKYKFNSSKSTCTNDVTPVWNDSNWDITLRGITKGGTSCYLYFDEQEGTLASDIIQGGTATDDSMFAGITGDGVYTWTKGDYSGGTETIKYYRGNVNNNWVVFGKDGEEYIWWRIIRTNSNGSLRIIYSGTSSSKTQAPTDSSQMVLSPIKYNAVDSSSFDETSYYHVGIKYTVNNYHGNTINSTVLGEINSNDKKTLYGWYNTTIAQNNAYKNALDASAGFCNDRESGSVSGGSTYNTYYGPYIRIVSQKVPSLLCTNTSDKFTDIPVGMITADEAMKIGRASCRERVS